MQRAHVGVVGSGRRQGAGWVRPQCSTPAATRVSPRPQEASGRRSDQTLLHDAMNGHLSFTKGRDGWPRTPARKAPRTPGWPGPPAPRPPWCHQSDHIRTWKQKRNDTTSRTAHGGGSEGPRPGHGEPRAVVGHTPPWRRGRQHIAARGVAVGEGGELAPDSQSRGPFSPLLRPLRPRAGGSRGRAHSGPSPAGCLLPVPARPLLLLPWPRQPFRAL